MRKAEVYQNGILAGILTETDNSTYVFTYNESYFNDNAKSGISLTLPKKQLEYTSEHLFPFFYNMLSEGSNRSNQAKQLKIDENDFMGLLMATAQFDTVGAVTVKPV